MIRTTLRTLRVRWPALLCALALPAAAAAPVSPGVCTGAADAETARTTFLALRERRAREPGSVPAAAYRAAAERWVRAAEACHAERFGTPSAGTTIDGGGVWFDGGGSAAEFRTRGTKWGADSPFPGGQDVPGPGTPGGLVTYSFMDDGVDNSQEGVPANTAITSLPTYAPCFVAEIQAAFDAWSAIADIEFAEVDDDGQPFNVGSAGSIRIGAHPFDGAGGVLAHAYFPPPNGTTAAGDIHFDVDENWACTDTGPTLDFGIVALHEIGHAIGLEHEETGRTAVMNAFYNPVLALLQPDDVDGAAAIYGPFLDALVTCAITADASIYSGSEPITFATFAIGNPGDEAVAVEWKAWMALPDSNLGFINAGADGTLVLESGFAADFGPVPFAAANELPPATYGLGCRLLDPTTGALLHESIDSFQVVP